MADVIDVIIAEALGEGPPRYKILGNHIHGGKGYGVGLNSLINMWHIFSPSARNITGIGAGING